MADEPVIPVAEAQDEGPIPPVALLGINGTESHKALVSIMSRGKRYIIVIVFHRMPHAMEHRALSLIKKYFFKAIERIDNPNDVKDIERWISEGPCRAILNKGLDNKPTQPRQRLPTLEEFFDAPSTIVTVKEVDGVFTAVVDHGTQEDSSDHPPCPRLHDSDNMGGAVSTFSPNLPAAWFEADLSPSASEVDYDRLPTVIRLVGSDVQKRFLFLPIFLLPVSTREIDILAYISRNPHLRRKRVAPLAGIIQTKSGFNVGYVVAYNKGDITLDRAIQNSSVDEREKWAMQIRDTVDDLHDAKLAWGGCKAEDILIGDQGHGDVALINFHNG